MPKNRMKGNNGKLLQMFPDFSKGLNTRAAVHQVDDSELVEGTNFEIDEQGSVSKRKGWTNLIASLGAGKVQGAYMHKRFVSRELLVVHNTKLYRYITNSTILIGSGTWEEVIIRRHAPQAVVATIATTGTVGANLVASTAYDYQVVAKDSAGVTLPSTVSRGTQGATPHPITVTWDKVLGCTGYDIYKNTKLIATVGDVSSWLDDGSLALGAQNLPVGNTTRLLVPSTSQVEFISYNDRAFFTTGAGICLYNGITASLVTPYVPSTVEESNIGANALRSPTSSIHKCRFIKLNWDRLFLAGDPDFPQNYYFTDINLSMSHPQMYFPGNFAADVTTANGNPITGTVNFRDGLVIFTSDSIHAVFGKQPDEAKPEPFVQRLIHPDIGCMSNRSITMVGNVVVFVARPGIYALSNVVASATALNVQYLSEKIEPTFRNLTHPEVTCATFHNQQYKVCFPEDGIMLRWYVNRQAWTLDTNCTFSAFVPWDTDLYAASYASGTVKKFGVKRIVDPLDPLGFVEVDTYSDDGAAIDFYARTKSYDLEAAINLKKFRKLYLMAKQYSVTSTVELEAHIDYTTLTNHFNLNESTVLGTWVLGVSRLGWVDVVFQEIRFKGKGHTVYFKFTNSVVDQPVTLYGLGIQYKLKHA